MGTLIQRSFGTGWLSPALEAKADQARRATGLGRLRNMLVTRHASVENRAGTTFADESRYPEKKRRAIPFLYSADPEQNYFLEFGDLYVEFVWKGGRLLEASKVLTALTVASPAVATHVAHGYLDGDDLHVDVTMGTVRIQRRLRVANKTNDTFELADLDGTPFDTTALGAFVAGGTVARVYMVVSPYAEAQLAALDYEQQGDVVELTHRSHAPQQIRRLAHASWQLSPAVFTPAQVPPTDLVAALGTATAGAIVNKYRVTAIDPATGEESLPCREKARTITGITQANPGVVTCSANHEYQANDLALLSGVAGMVEVNGNIYNANPVGGQPTKFELRDQLGANIDTTGFGAYVSGGLAERLYARIDTAAAVGPSATVKLTFKAVGKAVLYAVYKEKDGNFGFIGFARALYPADSIFFAGHTITYLDQGAPVNTEDQPPEDYQPFLGAGNYPGSVCFYQGRKCYGGTANKPNTLFGSRSGRYTNFTKSAIARDDDAIEQALAATLDIRFLVPLKRLNVLSPNSETVIEGDASGLLVPRAVNPNVYGANGTAQLKPVVMGNRIVYVQARGSIVRIFGYDLEEDAFVSRDLTTWSSHLVDGYTFRAMTLQRAPGAVLWLVRSDGKFASITYVREQQIEGCALHDTAGGEVEDAAVVIESEYGLEGDFLYLLTKRTINGKVRRYVERMKSRIQPDPKLLHFVDCGLVGDGRNVDPLKTMEISGGDEYTPEEILAVTASWNAFTADDVGNAVFFTYTPSEEELEENPDLLPQEIRFRITAYLTPTSVQGQVEKTVPVALREVPTTVFAKAAREYVGFWHLEGEKLAVQADGAVLANPNDPEAAEILVENGKIVLPSPAAVVHAGLPITADLETLNLEVPQGTMIHRARNVNEASFAIVETQGFLYGPRLPGTDALPAGATNPMTPFKIREEEEMGEPLKLRTGEYTRPVSGEWEKGRLAIRVSDPGPFGLAALALSGAIPAAEQVVG